MGKRVFVIVVLIITSLLFSACNRISGISKNSSTEISNRYEEKMAEIIRGYEEKEKLWINDERFNWITNTDKWDRIVVYYTYEPEIRYEITNEILLKNNTNCHWLFDLLKLAEIPPNGFYSDVDHYTYEFIKGDKTYKVNVVDLGVIEYEEEYYEASLYVHHLGKAFLAGPEYINTNSILYKLHESSLVMGQLQVVYPEFSTFRITGFSKNIQRMLDNGEATIISKPEEQIGDKIEYLTFYFYGQPIYMSLYKHYINIKDGNKDYWYRLKEENYLLTVLTAG